MHSLTSCILDTHTILALEICSVLFMYCLKTASINIEIQACGVVWSMSLAAQVMVEMYSLNHGPRAVIYTAHTVLQVCHLLPSIGQVDGVFIAEKSKPAFATTIFGFWLHEPREETKWGEGEGGSQVCMARNQRLQWQQQTAIFLRKNTIYHLQVG